MPAANDNNNDDDDHHDDDDDNNDNNSSADVRAMQLDVVGRKLELNHRELPWIVRLRNAV